MKNQVTETTPQDQKSQFRLPEFL